MTGEGCKLYGGISLLIPETVLPGVFCLQSSPHSVGPKVEVFIRRVGGWTGSSLSFSILGPMSGADREKPPLER